MYFYIPCIGGYLGREQDRDRGDDVKERGGSRGLLGDQLIH